ncbi:hypothetical protein NS07_v2contig00232-0005 [Nocardia seriolae]|nr:hypothetical protein NS07_v2contig00232-0005 [Nocardia seriolae]
MVTDVGEGDGDTGLADDDGVHALTPIRVRHTDYRAGGDGGVGGQGVLHLGGVHVLAAGDDHVLHPVDDVDVALVVHIAAVAGVHPAVADGRGGLVGLVPVAEHDVPAAHHDLADGAARHLRAVGIHDPHLRMRHRATRGAQPARQMVLGTQQRRDRRKFGHAVRLHETGVREHLHRTLQQCLRDGRGPVHDGPHTRHVVVGHLGVVDQHLNHHRNQHRLGDTVSFNGFHDGHRIEGRNHDVGAAQHQLPVPAGQVGEMEHGRGVQEARFRPEQEPGGQPAQGRHREVGLTEHDALGVAGGAAGVEDPGQLPAVAADIGHRLRGREEVFVGEHALRGRAVAAMDDDAHAGGRGANGGGHGCERVVHQQHPGIRIHQGIGDFRRAPANIDGIEHRVRPRHRQQVLVIAIRIQRQDADPVIASHSEFPQCSRQPGHPLGHLGEGAGPVAEDGHDGVRLLLHGPVQPLGEIHTSPRCALSTTIECRGLHLPSVVGYIRAGHGPGSELRFARFVVFSKCRRILVGP